MMANTCASIVLREFKILVLSHRLGEFRVTHRIYLWLEGKRIVDFLLAIIEFFSSRYLSRLWHY